MTRSVQNMTVDGQIPGPGTAAGLDSHQFFATVSSTGGDAVQLTLHGDVDLAVRDQLREIIETLQNSEGKKALLIDMTEVTFLDCGGIGVLVAGRRWAADVGRGYGVVNANGIVARVLAVTGVKPILDFPLVAAEGGTGSETS